MLNTDELKAKSTNGDNYEVSNEDVIARLEAWDADYWITISDISHDRVSVFFNTLPEDVRALAEEIYEFCPDTVDQGFGCYEEMIEMADETGQQLDPVILQVTEGVDFSDEGYGVELLTRWLKINQSVALWWD